MSSSGARHWIVLRGPLRSRNFRLLATCNIVSDAGSAVSFVTIPFAAPPPTSGMSPRPSSFP
jgi:hypothetical protein